jgi:hypothetical protein
MADPVLASDGFTYERDAIEQWFESHDVSPTTSEPLDDKTLRPNHMARSIIAEWCALHGVPLPTIPQRAAKAAAGGGAASAKPLAEKPRVLCTKHPKEQLRVFCNTCCRGVCVLCAVDSKTCKLHDTQAFETMSEELKSDREEWARAQEECNRSAEQLCAAIQADADAKKQAIDTEAAVLQQRVRAAAAKRSASLSNIVESRALREELLFGASNSSDIVVKQSPAAAAVAAIFDRVRARVPAACAATFQASAGPSRAVGSVAVRDTIIDPEDEVKHRGCVSCLCLHAVANFWKHFVLKPRRLPNVQLFQTIHSSAPPSPLPPNPPPPFFTQQPHSVAPCSRPRKNTRRERAFGGRGQRERCQPPV